VYFPTDEMRLIPTAPLEAGKAGHFAITVRLSGGGIHSQAEALRHGIARALVKNEETLRKLSNTKDSSTRPSRKRTT